MDSIQIPVTLTMADWEAYQAAYQSRWQNFAAMRRERVLSWLTLLGLVAIGLLTTRWLADEPSIMSFAFGAAVIAVNSFLGQRRALRLVGSDFSSRQLAASTVTFDASGILIEKETSTTRCAWAAVQGATVTAEHLFLWLSQTQGIIVPLRGLPQGLSPSQWIADLEAVAPAAFASVARAPTSIQGPQSVRESVREAGAASLLASIARLLTLRRASDTALQASDRAIFLLGMSGCLLALGIDRWLAGSPASFATFGLLVWAWYGCAALAAAWLISRVARPSVEFPRALLLLAAFFPAAMVLYGLTSLWVPEAQQSIAVLLIVLYGVLFLERGLRSITSRLQLQAVAMVMLLVGVLTVFSSTQYWSAQLWYQDDAETEDDSVEAWLQQDKIEGLLFAQASRIDAAVAKLRRPADRPAAAFFIGFAGYGEQRVFASEIALAQRVITTKFDATERALELVNDRRDLEAHPLASPTSLRYALKAVARRMNLEQDVLFLSVSSHGSKEGTVSVSNPGVPFNDLSAVELAKQLREAGIKWKVVMVSACYSGTFIEPLRNDHTIIITAAAADRTSFGCDDKRELTYFGEAFYRDALPNAASLRAAFEQTSRTITEREKREGKTPSHPQAFFGQGLEAHLRRLSAVD